MTPASTSRHTSSRHETSGWARSLLPNTGRELENTIEGFTEDLLPAWTSLHSSPTLADDKQLIRARNRLSEPKGRRRTTSLLVLLAHLGGTPFADVATLLGTSTPQLVRYVHVEASFPDSMFRRVMKVDEVLRYLHRVLEPSATNDWLHTGIPALGGATPFELIRRRKIEPLLEYVKTYTRPLAYS